VIRGAALVLVAAIPTGLLLLLLKGALPASPARAWIDERGWWLVWPVVALELAMVGTWWLGLAALVVGVAAYWLDTTGRLRTHP
jgi:hypothetical protein